MRAVSGLLLALAASASLAATALAAPRVPEAVLKAVSAEHDAAMQDMVDPEFPDAFKVATPLAMFSRVDLNGDGVADWRVDFEKAQNPSFFCGTGGCQQQLYVSRPGGGYALVFDTLVRQIGFRKAGGEHILDLDFHGTTCGGAGADDCPRRYAWSETAGRYIERINAKGDGWLVGGTRTVVEPDPAAFPPAVTAQQERRIAFCRAEGGAYKSEEMPPYDLPDLNGDGVRDWVVGASYAYCDMGDSGRDSPAMPVTILVSQPDGGFIVGWEQTEPYWGIDLGATNRLATIVGEDCHFGVEPCPRIWWRWTGTTFEQLP